MKGSVPVQAHVAGLDGLRGWAILGVLCVHAGVPGLAAGWIGVDLFFVLSGFLITRLLLAEQARHGQVALGAFWVRRALRLMPAYIVYIGGLTALLWLWPGSERSAHAGWTPLGLTTSWWTYTVNFVPQGGLWNLQELSIHLWSLSVEQQYYLLWPPILMLLIRHGHRALLPTLLIAIVVGVIFVCWPHGLWQQAMLFTRGFTVMAGSAAAVASVQRPGWHGHWAWRAMAWVGGAALVALLMVSAWQPRLESSWRLYFLPILVPAFACWTARLWDANSPVSRAWSTLVQHPALVYVGAISYGVYLYHQAVRMAVWHWGKPMMANWPAAIGFITRFGIYLALSIALAALSYRWIEQPFLRLARRFKR